MDLRQFHQMILQKTIMELILQMQTKESMEMVFISITMLLKHIGSSIPCKMVRFRYYCATLLWEIQYIFNSKINNLTNLHSAKMVSNMIQLMVSKISRYLLFTTGTSSILAI